MKIYDDPVNPGPLPKPKITTYTNNHNSKGKPIYI